MVKEFTENQSLMTSTEVQGRILNEYLADMAKYAGIVLKCQKIDHGFMPIAAYADLSDFNLYMGDVGMLTMKSGMAHQQKEDQIIPIEVKKGKRTKSVSMAMFMGKTTSNPFLFMQFSAFDLKPK